MDELFEVITFVRKVTFNKDGMALVVLAEYRELAEVIGTFSTQEKAQKWIEDNIEYGGDI
jgi:hypothetical protein